MDAVVFDLDDTLIVEEDYARTSLAAALASVGAPAQVDSALEAIREIWRSSPYHRQCLDLGIASWEGLWATFDGCHESLVGLREWIPEYRQRAWQAALRVVGGDERRGEQASQRYVAAQKRGHPVVTSAAETVRAVAHLRRGLLTNGPPDIQQLKVRQAGLANEFDVVAVSGQLGVGKPSRGAFEHVLKRLGTRPERTVMVGDSWARDIEPAVALGMRAIWVTGGREVPKVRLGVSVVEALDVTALEHILS
jgi:putative hydrolase of the HAD superfamily